MLDFTSSADVEDIGGAGAAPSSDSELLDAYSNEVISVADQVSPAVVRVETRGANGRPGGEACERSRSRRWSGRWRERLEAARRYLPKRFNSTPAAR